MASLMSPPFDSMKFSSPKRARLSLRHRIGHPPSKTTFGVDNAISAIDNTEEKMIIDNHDQEQDENISPNCNISETKFSPYISDDVVKRNYKVSALGLPNCGNTCYLNSILQVLRYTPDFSDTLHSLVSSQNQLAQICSDPREVKPDSFFHKLHMLYIAMKKQELLQKDQENYTPALEDHVESFISSLGKISSLFKEGEQNDAHEFLLTVLSHFDIISLKVKQVAEAYYNNSKVLAESNFSPPKEKRKLNKYEKCQLMMTNLDFVKKISSFNLGFEGNMQHTIKCLECEKRSDRIESFTNLEVSIAKDFVSEETVDLCQCLVQRTTLSGDNKYFCQECFHSTEAQLSSEMISLPSILVLHCNWLKQSSFLSQIEKDSTKIAIPLFIKTSENLNVFQNATDETYYLYAIVLHIGTSVENGHYVSFIKDMPETPEKSDYLMLKSNKQNCVRLRHCCALDIKTNCSTNNWLFFDDEEVLPLSLSDTSVFPYYEFMTTSASPSIIFYCKK